MPNWVLAELEFQRPALEAEELLALVSATLLPFQKEHVANRILRTLRGFAREAAIPKEKAEFLGYDPQKAAEYFKEKGWKVEDGNSR